MIGAIVQARMGSTRLPGKVLMEGAGKPLLSHLLERLKFCRHLETILVATTTEPQDDAIAGLCRSLGVPVYRGSEHDVLDRYYQAARAAGLATVVRVTSDCPLIDPELIDETILAYQDRLADYDLVTNRHPLTFVDGIDFDLIPMHGLTQAWQTARLPHQREHVVPFFWESGMRVANFEDPARRFYTDRWTLDYREDYELIHAIYTALYREGQLFRTAEIFAYLASNPHLSRLNSQYLPRPGA